MKLLKPTHLTYQTPALLTPSPWTRRVSEGHSVLIYTTTEVNMTKAVGRFVICGLIPTILQNIQILRYEKYVLL